MTPADPTDWIGRSQTVVDTLDTVLVARLAATLGDAPPTYGEALPPLWQWAFFVEPVNLSGIGDDGHPARGGFLPPAANRHRMWAGGRITFGQALRVGGPAERRSTVLAVKEKMGSTGALLFVTVRHEYHQEGVLAISEEQDIVYRQPAPPKLTGDETAPVPDWRETIHPTETLLFRYSAVTFNGHRIHYDYPYVTAQEGYPGLVVHGPLIATFMLNAFCRAHPNAKLESMTYRGLRPLIAPTAFDVAGRSHEPDSAELWAEQDGALAHHAQLRFSS